MELERIQARVTPRGPWQAMDLGAQMMRRWWRPLLGTWLLFTLVPFVALIGWLGPEHFFLASVIFWWLKPLWEKPLLEFCGRALFGEAPRPLSLLRRFPDYGFRGLFSLLTFRRLSPTRSFNLPVFQLERSRGEALSRRLRVLHLPPSNRAGYLTLVMIHMEQGLTLGFLLLFYFLSPWQFNLELTEWLMTQEVTHQWLMAGAWYLALCITEPLFVTCGFALYINRRAWLEAWDLELGLRRIGERRRAGGLAGLAAALMLILPLLGPITAEAQTDANPRDEAVEVLAEPDFMPMERELGWRQREWLREQDTLQTLLDWLFGDAAEVDQSKGPPDLAWLPEALRLTLWVVAVSLLLWLLWHYRHWLAELAGGQRRPRPAVQVGGLDIRPESLPDDIPEAAAAALARGDARAALGLLYRASLSRLVYRDGLPVDPGTTEGECLTLLRRRHPEPRLLALMERLTALWSATAWAHRPAEAQAVEDSLAQWRQLFAAREPADA